MENKTQTPDKKNIPTKSGMYHQMNGFQKFLMMCSGSNIHILQKSPSEWNKYAGIGELYFLLPFLLHFQRVMPCLRFSKMFGFRLDLGFYGDS